MKSLNRFALVFFATLLVATFGGAAADDQGTQYSATTPAGSGSIMDDAALTAEVKTQLSSEPSLKNAGIEVTTTAGVVRLSGSVSSPEQALTAVQFANSVAGVVSVTNDIQVR